MNTKSIPYYEVFAFTRRMFAGNPAGVCLLEEWLPNEQLQAIAAQNNLAETAFFIARGDFFELRWMTPTIEVDLCGHATLASAHVLFRHLGYAGSAIRFHSQSGELKVERAGDRLVLDFPSRLLEEAKPAEELNAALGARPEILLQGRDYFAVFASQQEVAALQPDLDRLAKLEAQGVVVTAPGDDCDFVSRYFAPAAGIPEDPVTGSTHCTLIPYWSQRLGKKELFARQISARGGELFCEDRGDRVGIGGQALTYVEGKIHLSA
ncbi:MAG: PhzF family phenazine biosynthesis protein [Verrucomicrobiota bacterium]|nr:PhzF family phenazine biosynthesis protein [Verrucomicrobiota bacterium]